MPAKWLLIVPEGIEMRAQNSYTPGQIGLLIVPEGIEMQQLVNTEFWVIDF